MFETYEITYVGAKSYPHIELKYDAKKREEARLKGEIRQLGNVNVNAIEEYDALRERYERYTKQQADIIDTEKKLKEIIAQLTTLMEVQFREQFKIISRNFSKVFAEMFGGGKAALKLADDSDVLNCGIDIEAQPPGKALQNMMLLSGGEKAMTAISLLFSILEMKPSPFCILDEIEAALDDANVVRFAEYLRNFTDTTQFIVITHRPGTREVADMLYGVTQERGISKLFSTNLEEIMKERENSGNI
jgi:chromosome segregation protein